MFAATQIIYKISLSLLAEKKIRISQWLYFRWSSVILHTFITIWRGIGMFGVRENILLSPHSQRSNIRWWIILDCEIPSSFITSWVLLIGFASVSPEQGHGIHTVSPTWPCQILKVLATQEKFLGLFGYSTLINCVFNFQKTNVFAFLHNIMTQLNL